MDFLKKRSKDPNVLLKLATSKRSGNVEEAIEILKRALDIIDRSGESEYYGVKIYLRMASYLRDATRYDEAWGYLNSLILRFGHSSWGAHCNLSEIYNAQRILLQYEGKFEKAIQSAAMSRFYLISHFHKEDLPWRRVEESCRDVLRRDYTRLLKKAKLLHQLEKICDTTEYHIKKIPKSNVRSLVEDIAKAMREDPATFN